MGKQTFKKKVVTSDDVKNKILNMRIEKKVKGSEESHENKAGYTATTVACGWAGAVFEVTLSFGQEQ